jgi:hypothetical protein
VLFLRQTCSVALAARQPVGTGRARSAGASTLGDAASRAMDADSAFDPGVALLALFDEQIVVSIGGSQGGAA